MRPNKILAYTINLVEVLIVKEKIGLLNIILISIHPSRKISEEKRKSLYENISILP